MPLDEQIEALAPPALHRQADRQRKLHVSPATVSRILQAARAQPDQGPGAGRAGGAATSASSPARLIHLDIKKLGRFDADRSPHHRRSQRPEHWASAGRRARLGVRPCLPSTTPRASPSPRSSPTRRSDSAIAFLKAARRLLREPRRHGRPGDDRQWLLLQILCLPRRLPTTSASNTSAPSPTRQRPTARPSASSRPACASGPTPRPINTHVRRAAELPYWLHRYNWHQTSWRHRC